MRAAYRNPAALALALLTASFGCGPSDPYANNERPDRPAKTQTTGHIEKPAPNPAVNPDGTVKPAPEGGEVNGSVPPELRRAEPASFPGAGTTPESTLRHGADLYGNWTSNTAPARFRQIAALSVDPARVQLRQIATQSGIDVQQAGVRATSKVMSISVNGTGGRRDANIVTRDQVTGPGLGDQEPKLNVTVATVQRRAGKWVISRWEPKP